MKKSLIWSIGKYTLALGLLAFLIWFNWGRPSVPGLGPTHLLVQSLGAQGVAPAGAPLGGTAQQVSAVGVMDSEAFTLGHGLADTWQKHVVEGRPIHYPYLIVALLVLLSSVLLTFVRWYILVRAQGLPFTLPDALRLGMVGFFFNIFLPGAVGGDIIKATFVAREQSRRTVAVATVLMDRAFALWGWVWFVALIGPIFWAAGMLPQENSRPCRVIILTTIVLVAVSGSLWALLGLLSSARAERFAGRLTRLPRVGPAAAEFWRAVWMFRFRQRSVYAAMLLACCSLVGFVVTYYCCVRALWDLDPVTGQPTIPTLTEHFLLVPIGLIVQALPGLPGGLGQGEAAFGVLYTCFGCFGGTAIQANLTYRVVGWTVGLLGYLVYLQMRPAIRAATARTAPPVPLVPVPAHAAAENRAAV